MPQSHRGSSDFVSTFFARIRRFLPLFAAIGLTISQPAAAQTTITYTDTETNAATYDTTSNNLTLTITSGSADTYLNKRGLADAAYP